MSKDDETKDEYSSALAASKKVREAILSAQKAEDIFLIIKSAQ